VLCLIKKLGKTFIPDDEELKEEVLWTNHDAPISGHPGQYRTQNLINQDYWWSNMAKDVQKYDNGCETCQRTKIHCNKPHAPLHPTDLTTKPWETISMDVIGP